MNSNEMEKAKENGLLPTLFFFSHSNKTLLLLSSAIAFDGIWVRVWVSTLLWRTALNGSENEIMVAHSSQNLAHIVCTRQVICSAHHHQKPFFSLAPRYNQPKATVRRYERRGKKWSDENKLFHIIFFACFIASNAWMKCTSTLPATTCSKNSRMKLFCSTHACESTHILKSLLSFELALIEWKIVNAVIAGISALLLLLPSPIPLSSWAKPWLATKSEKTHTAQLKCIDLIFRLLHYEMDQCRSLPNECALLHWSSKKIKVN